MHKYIAKRDVEHYLNATGYHPEFGGWKGGQMAIAVGGLESLVAQAAITALEHLPGSSPSDPRVLAARADPTFGSAACPDYGRVATGLFPWFDKWCKPFSACPLLASNEVRREGAPDLAPLATRNLTKLEEKLHYGATDAILPVRTDWNQLRRNHLAGQPLPAFDAVVLNNKIPKEARLATSYLFERSGDHSDWGVSVGEYVAYRHHFPTILDYEWACEAIESLLGPYLYRVLDALFPLRPPEGLLFPPFFSFLSDRRGDTGTDIGFLNALPSRFGTLEGAPLNFRAAVGGSRVLAADTDRIRFLYTTLVPAPPVLAGDQLRYVQENEDALRVRSGTTVWRLGLDRSVAAAIPDATTRPTFGEFIAAQWNPTNQNWNSFSDKADPGAQAAWPANFAQTPYASNPRMIMAVVLPALVGDTLVKATKGLLRAIQVWLSMSLRTCPTSRR